MLSHWATAAWAIVGAIASEMFFLRDQPLRGNRCRKRGCQSQAARVLAIGDMHNSLKFPDTRTYPVRYGLFQDGGYHFFSL